MAKDDQNANAKKGAQKDFLSLVFAPENSARCGAEHGAIVETRFPAIVSVRNKLRIKMKIFQESIVAKIFFNVNIEEKMVCKEIN